VLFFVFPPYLGGMSSYDETVALCALNKIFGYHPRLALDLMEKAGCAINVFAGPPPVIPDHPELGEQIRPEALDNARTELHKIGDMGCRFISVLDDDYPAALQECPGPPLGLYMKASSSATEVFGLRPMVAFVGTRDLSPYGKAWCQKLVKALSEAPVQPAIVSGLALGVDGVAHRTALECGLPTVGVMATGIEAVYPWQHEKLAAEMVSAPGSALITDYPLETSPVALNFVRRNRIIAGLVSAVVVVESKTKGGSLMTAKYAVEYNREVFAVPGRLDDIRSAGCNSLIASQMARIVTSPEQLVDALGLGGPRRHRGEGGSWVTSRAGDPPEKVLQAVLARKYGPGSPLVEIGLAVQRQRGITPEGLVAAVHRPYGEVLAGIGTLEVDGFLSTDLLQRCSIDGKFA
jgi:DNA processing protein